MQLGKTQQLKVLRNKPQGFYLTSTDSDDSVLLPKKYAPEDLEIDDFVDVFVYHDNDGRPIATTQKPIIELGEFATLEAVEANNHGAFFNWGIDRDLFVPHSQQIEPIQVGEFFVVYLYEDKKSNRLVGTTRIDKVLSNDELNVKVGDAVECMPFDESDLGYKCIVNQRYNGLLYKNEVFFDIQAGDIFEAFVKKIRSDNKIDLSVNQFGHRAIDDNAQKVLDVLHENGGLLPLTDKSSPDEIYNKLGMSKKMFKKAIGALYKQRMIFINPNGLKLKTNPPKNEKSGIKKGRDQKRH